MGCFNTKGFFSRVDIEYRDKAFVLVCTQYSSPIVWKELEEEYGEHEYENEGTMYPISFPIFGEYNDYGQLENIIHDFNTDKIESRIEDSIENFLDILYKVTVFPHYLNKEQIDKYLGYKEKLGLMTFFENLERDYHKYNIDRKMSLQKWIDFHINSMNQELIWTMDHSWVYTTLGNLYEVKDKKKILNPSSTTVWTNLKLIWGDEIYEHPEETSKFLSFIRYISINRLTIDLSFCTGQDVDWESIKKYTSVLDKFIDKKIEDV